MNDNENTKLDMPNEVAEALAASVTTRVTSGLPLETKDNLIEVAPGVHVSKAAIDAAVRDEVLQSSKTPRKLIEQDIQASYEYNCWQRKQTAAKAAVEASGQTIDINGSTYIRLSELPIELQEVIIVSLLVGDPAITYQRLCDKIEQLWAHATQARDAAQKVKEQATA